MKEQSQLNNPSAETKSAPPNNVPLPTVQKCVKMRSKRMPLQTCEDVAVLMKKCGMCKTLLYQRLSRIKYMSMVKSGQQVRNMIREEQCQCAYGLHDICGGYCSDAGVDARTHEEPNVPDPTACRG